MASAFDLQGILFLMYKFIGTKYSNIHIYFVE